MKEKIEQAIRECLEENGYVVRLVEIGKLPHVVGGREYDLMMVDVPLQVRAIGKDTSLGRHLN